MPSITLLNNSQRKAFTTLYRQKVFLSIGSDKHDGLLTLCINEVTGFIERYVRRSLLSQTYTNEVYDGNGYSTLMLKQFPVTSLSSFQARRSSDPSDDNWDTLSTSYYAWFSDGRLKLLSGSTVEVPQKYRVTYVAGYKIDFDNENDPSLHTLPPDIEMACQRLVSALFNIRKGEGLSDSSQGDTSVTLKAEVFKDPEIASILDRYAAPVI